MSGQLTIAPPEKMDIDSIITWIKERAVESARLCEEGEQFYQRLKGYHQNIASLMGEMAKLKQSNNSSQEDLEFIVDTVSDTIEAINNLVNGSPLEHFSVEALEDDINKTVNIKQAAQRSNDKFLNAYIKHKVRLGLTTQEEVAQLTGLNRRQVSAIENAKHKPQFKTIKKIADRFGADIGEFI